MEKKKWTWEEVMKNVKSEDVQMLRDHIYAWRQEADEIERGIIFIGSFLLIRVPHKTDNIILTRKFCYCLENNIVIRQIKHHSFLKNKWLKIRQGKGYFILKKINPQQH